MTGGRRVSCKNGEFSFYDRSGEEFKFSIPDLVTMSQMADEYSDSSGGSRSAWGKQNHGNLGDRK